MRSSVGAGAERPVTVLHLIDCLNPGGTESQLLGHLRLVDRRRFRPLIGSFHEGGLLVPDVRALGVPIRAFPLRYSLAHPNTALQIARIVRYCRREGVRIVHGHDYYGNLVGVAAGRLAGARVVCSRRDLAHFLSVPKKRALALACRAADRVVANARSVAMLGDANLRLPPSRIELIPNGIDVAAFDAQAVPEPEPRIDLLDRTVDRAWTVAVVSNMNLPHKGQQDLLQAAAQLAEEGLLLRILLVGDGPERPALEALGERLGLSPRLRFLGRRRDVPRLLARVAAACLPSWAEGFPNAVMEAMAAARPVVATRVGGCPELVEDGVTGLLVPPRDPTALAAALRRVFADPVWAATIGRQARQAIAERFDLARTTAALETLYDQLSGRRLG